ncbi:Asp23/Gls24 family envelope stress response protein [Streptomyces sp. NP160]|uniref:Asp23/Gls24 family envelope stress response protein n=1 Tax=Streptomyces sp. NP160 TaxID=2586637 RepID=UPI0011186FA7|nr:Asp23/Gls24 family envelope stress response protein [Streptomyces sp. NP160]TNM67178.1 Asp23/Gls24 family envelope stress response protein [Streptomyces sp. NP160]
MPATPAPGGGATGAEAEVAAVDAVVATVLGVPGVAGLSAGPAGSAATLLPGRRIDGVALRPAGTEVHVAVTYGVDVRATARAVHDAVAGLGSTVPQPVNVHVEDVLAR